MNITRKRAKFTAFLFGGLFFFLVLYFVIVGSNRFLNNSIHYAINALVFVICFLVYAAYLKITNKKTHYVDERDTFIQKKSYGISLIIILMYVYLLCTILWVIYKDVNVIQVSWIWFIAYSTFAFAYFMTSSIILYHYNKE